MGTQGVRMQTKLQKIFKEGSVFSFICPNCKTNKALRTLIDEYKKQITDEYTLKVNLHEKRENELETALGTEKATTASLFDQFV